MEEITGDIARAIQRKYDREVNSREIGELIMEKFAALDDVTYVWFASVYRQFRDVNQFMNERQGMLKREKK